MRFNRANLLALGLTIAIGGIPAVIANPARAQEPSQQEPTKPEKESKKERQANERRSSTESRKTTAERPEAQRGQNEKANREQARPNQRTEAAPATGQKQAHEGRVAQGRQAPRANAHYHFRQQDAAKLRQHYQAQLAHVDRANRPHVVSGGTIPTTYVTYIQPVPQDVIVYVEPPPPGYEIGFLDGYIIVYDPNTFLVLDVIDLLS